MRSQQQPQNWRLKLNGVGGGSRVLLLEKLQEWIGPRGLASRPNAILFPFLLLLQQERTISGSHINILLQETKITSTGNPRCTVLKTL